MQIYTGTQIKDWDSYTIEHEPIRSVDLMERAAGVMADAIVARYGKERSVVVFAGPGNNGGDALAVARLLAGRGYGVEAFLFNVKGSLSEDCATNKERLQGVNNVKRFVEVTSDFSPPRLGDDVVVVDGLFGSGLKRPLDGGFASLVRFINSSAATTISIDIPSGLMTEDNTTNVRQNIVQADLTLTLGQRKLAMYMADNTDYLGEVVVLDIGLSRDYMEKFKSPYSLLEECDIRRMVRQRSKFAHKGMMGHVLLIAGSYGMCGAAILAGRSVLRSGAGKLTIHSPRCNNDILQVAIPEAVIDHDDDDIVVSKFVDANNYSAVAIGPGLGRHSATAAALLAQIRDTQVPLVLDADAINLLGIHRQWIDLLPHDTILTPHPAEFDRLTGGVSNGSFDRLSKAVETATRLHVYVVLKGHYTALCCPDGEVMINSTGNPGMATAGAGDVLTGIIVGLLARGYSQREACSLGVYVHGLAGDIAKDHLTEESIIASDLIACLPQAFKQLYLKTETI